MRPAVRCHRRPDRRSGWIPPLLGGRSCGLRLFAGNSNARGRCVASGSAVKGRFPMNYVKDGATIYRESFSIIRRESDLSAFAPDLVRVVVRMIHACGMTDLPQDVQASPDAAAAGTQALLAGAPLLCDATMVADGITRSRLPRMNEVICALHDPQIAELAANLHTTRSAAAIELWRDRLAGSVVVIGNAPTALFHLLDLLGGAV